MFPSTIRLNTLNGGKTDFVQYQLENRGSVRKDSAAKYSAPRTMAIRHTDSKSKSGITTDRHLVQFAATEMDAVTGEPVVALINTTFQVPRHSLITGDLMLSLSTLLQSFLGIDWSTYVPTGIDPHEQYATSDDPRLVTLTGNMTLARLLLGEY